MRHQRAVVIRRRNLGTAVVAAALLVAPAVPMHGQSRQRVSLEVGGAYSLRAVAMHTGNANVLLNRLGPEVQLRVTPGRLSAGVGYHRSDWYDSYDLAASGTVTLSDVFLEPRLLVAGGAGRVAGYLSARVGYGMLSCDDCGDARPWGGASDATTVTLGGGGGMLLRLGTAVAADAGLHLVTPVETGSYGGGRIMLRLGVVVGLF